MVRDEHHFVMKVRGSSMNQSGIHDGDYVVLRSQATAENSDIVAAEILNVDTSRATLKRYNRRGDTITLSAESDDPEFEGKEWDFSLDAENSEDDGFFIRGVAVAVLKPAL
jgi:SOS-response transcriptional repressor LexA